MKNGYLCRAIAVVLLLCDHRSKYQALFDFCCYCRILRSTFNFYSRLWSYALFPSGPFKPSGRNSGEWHLWKLNRTIETAESQTRHLETCSMEFPNGREAIHNRGLFVIIFKTWTFRVYRSIYYTASLFPTSLFSIHDLCFSLRSVLCHSHSECCDESILCQTTALPLSCVRRTIECEEWFLFVFYCCWCW